MRLIQDGIGSLHQTDWVQVNALNMRPCISFLKCRPNKKCKLPFDDAHKTAALIYKADALVIGSPTYFGNITGPLKILIDRSLTAFEEIAVSGLEMPKPIHKGQKAAIVTACNMPAPMGASCAHGGGALMAMQTVVNAGGYDLVGSIRIDGAAALTAIPLNIKKQAKIIADALTN